MSTAHNPASAQFPGGSVTWNWHSPAPVASYLVEDSVGNYHLTERTADNGIRYYEAQDASIPPAQQKQNLSIMKQQEDITAFQSQFNGTFPFTSDGVIIGTPPASFEEEMETMITFAGGTIGLSVFNHENFHQWWGDNVTESAYNMTFFKEGMATIGQDLLAARQAEDAAGGPTSRKGQAAFQATLVKIFNQTYAEPAGFWATAPSNPTPFELFSSTNTYNRPAATYLALRQILGSTNFTQAMQQIQRQYGGSHITEPELEAAFHQWMPNTTRACQAKLTTFFTEWFDNAYPTATGQTHPDITGPGLSGPGFYNKTGGCTTP
jgi:aminopeptidase N